MARPKEFDEEAVLDRAVDLFWRQGYEATSIQDLVDHLGINRGSLYATFGDKHQLFLKAVDHYCKTVVRARMKSLASPGAGLGDIRGLFGYLVDMLGSEAARRGCLVANAAIELAPVQKDTEALIVRALKETEDVFYRVLKRAQKTGELAKEKNPRALASFLMGLLQGGLLLVRAGMDRDALRHYVQAGLSVL